MLNPFDEDNVLNRLRTDAHAHGRFLLNSEIHRIIAIAGIYDNFAHTIDFDVHIVVFLRTIIGEAVAVGGADLAVHANVKARQQRVKTVEDQIAFDDGFAVGVRIRDIGSIRAGFHSIPGNDGDIGDGAFAFSRDAERLQEFCAQRIPILACAKIDAAFVGTFTHGDEDIDDAAGRGGQIGLEVFYRAEQRVANGVVGRVVQIHGSLDGYAIDGQRSAAGIDGVVLFRFRFAIVHGRRFRSGRFALLGIEHQQRRFL